MKRMLTVLLCAVYLAAPTGCAHPAALLSSNTVPQPSENLAAWTLHASADVRPTMELSPEDAAILEKILANGSWSDGLPVCDSDYRFEAASGETYAYHTDCGTFINDQNAKSLKITEEQKNAVNRMIEACQPTELFSPPECTVCLGDNSIQAWQGTASWNYDNGDGTWTGINSDSMHPLDAKGELPVLPVSDVREARLQFAVYPDEISIRCWSDREWGNSSAPAEALAIDDFTFTLKEEGCIYEITATWNSAEHYNGTAIYAFYAAPM